MGRYLVICFCYCQHPFVFHDFRRTASGEEESYPILFRKRILHTLLSLLTFSLLVYLITLPQRGEASAADFFCALLAGDINVTYWYLYAYLGFLLALPFLRKIARHLCFRDMLFLYALRFFFVTLNLIVNLILRYAGAQPIAISGYLQAPMATLECLLYPLMGYFLAEKLPMEKVQRKHLVASVIILISGCILAAVTTYAEHLRFDATQNYIGLSNYTSAAVVFFLVRYFCEKHTFSAKWAHRLQTISSLTVGIYLLEPVVHLLHGPFFEHIYWHPVLITLFSIVWAVLCMAIGGTATWLLRKIPGVKTVL